MKPLDYLVLALIMAAIFGCGARFGWLLCVRRHQQKVWDWCQQRVTPESNDSFEKDAVWKGAVLMHRFEELLPRQQIYAIQWFCGACDMETRGFTYVRPDAEKAKWALLELEGAINNADWRCLEDRH